MTVQNTQTETVRTEAAPQQGGNTNPGYYKNRAFECVGFAQYLNFNLGNAFKYIWRHKEKGGREDLEKALRYLERQRAGAPKFKKLKCRRYEKMYAGLKDCGFDGGTEAALLAVISAAYYIRDGEDNFAWAAACVEDLLEKMPPEAGRAPHPESPMPPETAGGGICPANPTAVIPAKAGIRNPGLSDNL
ncbi:DUF3310 domain-containing protein [Neisseria gonorrhoeae]|uniref:DUF3310 domain-containing protein n=1 Tax=Neisseria gonorrhoeae TaxID=485 RepID=UPI003974DE68